MRSFVVVVALLLASPALACSAGPCTAGYLMPEHGSLPVSHAAFLWISALSWGKPPAKTAAALAKLARKVQLRRAGDKTSLPVTLVPHETFGYGYWVKPTAGFQPDTEYVLDAPDQCEGAKPGTMHRASLTITPGVPTPATLGKLVASQPTRGRISVATTAGSCSTEIDASYVDVSVEPSAAARPLADLFQYTTYVDGTPWRPTTAIYLVPRPDQSWVGHGRDRVFAYCPGKEDWGKPEPMLPPGKHSIEMRGQLPGAPTALSTGVVEVELRCGP